MVTIRFTLRKCLNIIGGLLGVAGVIFVVLKLYDYSERVDLGRFDVTAWWIVAFLVLIYGAANILLAVAWWNLLHFLGVNTQLRWALRIYGITQVGKYVPGNIFHLAGRQALGMGAGLPGGNVAKSTLWELALIAVAGSLFCVLLLPLIWNALPGWVPLALFLTLSIAIILTLFRLFATSVGVALLWQLMFLATSGTVFIVALSIIGEKEAMTPAYSVLCGAYVIAWLAGLVTPGAPAGIGVREMVLLMLLGGHVAQADLLLAVILSRIVTLLGDFCFFILASFLRNGTQPAR